MWLAQVPLSEMTGPEDMEELRELGGIGDAKRFASSGHVGDPPQDRVPAHIK